ncbi:hypothetical protein [Paenibacillus allorhizoplanae]|nr:hypothetical protein [Paenibacillus allorhizoplanae]
MANSKEFAVYGILATPINLAAGKVVTVSSSSGTKIASNAIDANYGTE